MPSVAPHPSSFPAPQHGKSTEHRLRTSTAAARANGTWRTNGACKDGWTTPWRGDCHWASAAAASAAGAVGSTVAHTTPHVRCCRTAWESAAASNSGAGYCCCWWVVPGCSTEICHATRMFKCWRSWVGVTGGATGTGPPAIAECTGEGGRGTLFGSCGLRGLRPITDGERTDATSRLSVRTSSTRDQMVSWFAWHTFTRVARMRLTDGGAAECGGTQESGTVCGWEGGASCTWLNGARGDGNWFMVG